MVFVIVCANSSIFAFEIIIHRVTFVFIYLIIIVTIFFTYKLDHEIIEIIILVINVNANYLQIKCYYSNFNSICFYFDHSFTFFNHILIFIFTTFLYELISIFEVNYQPFQYELFL